MVPRRASVEQAHAQDNRLNRHAHRRRAVTYDPRRLQEVTVYREAERAFATGDRVQFIAPHQDPDGSGRSAQIGQGKREDPFPYFKPALVSSQPSIPRSEERNESAEREGHKSDAISAGERSSA
jgi:hypothetical protein